MTSFAAFLTDIRPLMPAATVMSVIRSARHTTRAFFKETGAYECDFTNTDCTIAGRVVTLDVPDDTEIISLAVFKHGESTINPSSKRDMQLNNVGYGFYITPPASMTLNFDPSAALSGTARLIPAYNAVDIPDALFGRYYETLLNGVMADMYAMENSAWFDPNKANLRGQQYAIGVEEAKSEVDGSNMFKPSLAQYRDI